MNKNELEAYDWALRTTLLDSSAQYAKTLAKYILKQDARKRFSTTLWIDGEECETEVMFTQTPIDITESDYSPNHEIRTEIQQVEIYPNPVIEQDLLKKILTESN